MPDRFDQLFERQCGPLCGLAYRVLGDAMASEEVVQEGFVRLSRDAVLARPDDEVAAWLRRVCLNLAFNRRRDERRLGERHDRLGRIEANGQAADPAVAVLQREDRAEVRRALAELPERQRDCLLLRHSGYSYAEIAATLQVAMGSVGVLLARAERAFKEKYRENDLP